MPAVAERKLSLEEFHARYDGEKPYFEYWDGEAVQKSMPTRVHGLIEEILVVLLRALGFDPCLGLVIKLDPAYEPIPDVVAAEGRLGDPYPTEPFEVVIEILSSQDTFSRVLQKCQLYDNWGIRQIVIVDPKERLIWKFENGKPYLTDIIAHRGERVSQTPAGIAMAAAISMAHAATSVP